MVLTAILLAGGQRTAAAATITFECCAYAPPTVTVAPGEQVTWVGSFGAHPLVSRPGETQEAWPTVGTGTTFSRTYSTPGVWHYYCAVHGSPDGSQMSGEVVVAAAPPVGAPGPGPGGPPPGGAMPGGPGSSAVGQLQPAPGGATTASEAEVDGAARDRRKPVLRVTTTTRAAVPTVRLRSDEPSRATVRLSASNSTLTHRVLRLDAEIERVLTLRPSRAAAAKLRGAGKRVRARLTVTVTDAAGNTRTVTRTIVLRP